MSLLFTNYMPIVIETFLFIRVVNSANFHDFDSSQERIHFRCRTKVYPFSVVRMAVPDSKVRWTCEWSSYRPPVFTAMSTVGQPWADPDLTDDSFDPQWNSMDKLVNRESYITQYNVSGLYPVNPIGRTGLGGRGVLGRWGPNHAADSAVTRWKRDENNSLVFHPVSGKPILQVIAIQKRSGEWGLPGGMVNPGETPAAASKREFFEEVLAYHIESPDSVQLLDTLFENRNEIYKGYVDDPRNTDNAWVETTVFHYHDESGVLFNVLRLEAGDDARNVSWMDVNRCIQLYSAHEKFVHVMTDRLNAHF